MEGRGPWSRIVCCGRVAGGLGRGCRGRRGVGSLVGGRLSSWSLGGEWLGEHGECSADRFVGFGDWYGHVFGDGYVVVGAGCAFGVPCVGVGPLHGGSGAGCACRVVHGGRVCPLNRPAGEEGAGVQGAFGSLTSGAEHGPGSVAGMGCSGCCGTEVFTPVAFQRWGPRPRGCTEALRLFVVEESVAGGPPRLWLCGFAWLPRLPDLLANLGGAGVHAIRAGAGHAVIAALGLLDEG